MIRVRMLLPIRPEASDIVAMKVGQDTGRDPDRPPVILFPEMDGGDDLPRSLRRLSQTQQLFRQRDLDG
jgi:hypothetical protein